MRLEGVVLGDLKPIQVSLLGGRSLTYNGNTIDGRNIRSKRIWTLLEYLITYHFGCVAQDELVDLFYREDNGGTPSGALKTLVHCAREALSQLGLADGKEMSLRCVGGCGKNPDIPLEIYTERFAGLIREAVEPEKDKDKQQWLWLAALDLYKGDFLPEASTEIWAMSIATYFHFQYMNIVKTALSDFTERGSFDDAVLIAGRAIAIAPYDEALYYNLISALEKTNRLQADRAQYENMTKLFYGEFGVTPSRELQALYKKLAKSDNGVEKDLGVDSADLCEEKVRSGAFLCEYEFFWDIFMLERSSAARDGRPVNICLISTEDKERNPLRKKAQNDVMRKLCDYICNNLRSGDVLSRYGVSQYIVLLLISSCESCEKAIERVFRLFRRDNSRSPAAITYSLQTVETSVTAI